MTRMMLALSVVVLLGISGCSVKSKPTIIVAEETLSQAEDKGFDYSAVLARAEQGDQKAIAELMRFSLETDAAGALGHGVVLVELVGKVGDRRFADVATKRSGRIKEVVAEMLRGGEAYIQPPLDGPLREVYPETCNALFTQG